MRLGTLLVALFFTLAAVVCVVWLAQPAESRPMQKTVVEPNKEERPRPSPTGPHPKAVCDDPLYEFGMALTGKKASHTFVIRNEGEAPLLLSKGATSCKCTLSEMADGSIPPGGSAKVTLTWTPEQPNSIFSQSADIYTNDPKNEVMNLRVQGEIDDLVRVEPQDVWMAGEVSGHEPRVLSGMVRSAFLEEFHIHELISTSEWMQAEATPLNPATLASSGTKSGYEVKLTLSPDGPLGSFNEELTMRTDIRGGTDLKVRVLGHRQGPIQVVPLAQTRWYSEQSLIGLGRFAARDGAVGKLAMFVDLPPDHDLQIEVVECSPEFLKVSLERDTNFQSESRARYGLQIEIPPGLPPTTRTGDNAATFTLKTNHPSAPLVTLKVGFVAFRSS
jgi:hypothetical protein